MSRGLVAALPYFAWVFAAGFGLGTLRVLVLVPALGDLAAVGLEVPLMLAVSWLAARRVVARRDVPPRAGPRLAMGAGAVALLMAAELALAVGAFDQTPLGFASGLVTPSGLLGLGGQVAFGLMPLALLARPRRGG